jgi:adenylate cyclase
LSQGQRRLAAIMFTDIVGYTSISQRNEASALQLLEEHRGIVRSFFTKHNGTEIKTMGDAFLVEFASALEAVRCAFDIQQSLNELNADRPLDRRILVRIGIHLGDVVHSQNDVYGDAVNIASRIQPLSEPGGICVTSQVYDQVRNKFEFPMTTLGRRQLKNVGEPTEAYRVVLPWTQKSEAVPLDIGHRVAVLPFTNMSPDPNDEYFADGLTEELISTVSRIEGIEVISRTSVMQYKKAPKPIRDVSKELEVGTVLEGSVRKAGNKLRVAVQMIDAGRDRHLWAESYDRDLQDVFAIQSDIAKRVADALEARIPRDSAKAAEPKADVEAYTTYMKAMQLYHEGTEQSLREAVVLFNNAIARDTSFARAYAGLAHALCLRAAGGYDDFSIVDNAEAAARKALELGPDLAEAHAAMADVNGFLDRFEEEVTEARRAIEINPNDSEAHLSLAVNYSALARMDEAREVAQKAYDLDPLSFRTGHMLAWVSLMSGRAERALEIFTRLKQLNPRNPRAYSSLSEYYMLMTDFGQAQKMLEAGSALSESDPIIRLDRGLLYAFTGRRKEAEEVLREIMASDAESVRLYGALFINCALGNIDEAFKALMRTAETHSWPYLINVSPLFRDLRADPRFAEFRERLGLPPAAPQP